MTRTLTNPSSRMQPPNTKVNSSTYSKDVKPRDKSPRTLTKILFHLCSHPNSMAYPKSTKQAPLRPVVSSRGSIT